MFMQSAWVKSAITTDAMRSLSGRWLAAELETRVPKSKVLYFSTLLETYGTARKVSKITLVINGLWHNISQNNVHKKYIGIIFEKTDRIIFYS